MSDKIYLDYAAATPLDEAFVLKKMAPYFSTKFFNPSASYLAAREVKQELNAFRSSVANIIGSKPMEINFTAGGSEANNLAIHGLMRKHNGKNIIISSIEHESVLNAAKKYDHKIAPVDKKGVIDLVALENLIDENTVLVSVMMVNNEIGTIEPIRDISKLISKIRQQRNESKNTLPLYLHTDACQATNYIGLQVSRLSVDLMSVNGGKIYGPKQSGFLFVKSGIILDPIVDGGGQEHGLRSGTESLANIAGISEALTLAQGSRKEETSKQENLRDSFIKQVQSAIPQAILNGSTKHRIANNIHFTFPGIDNERLLIQLDNKGIMAAAGSACSASNDEPSHVLKAIGLTDDQAQSSIRITLGKFVSQSDVDKTVKTLIELINI